MNRDTPFGDTKNLELVGVSCDRCGTHFKTDEGTARRAHNERHELLLCDDCTESPSPPPSRDAPERYRVDEVRDGRNPATGPDAEPDISVEAPDTLAFGELAGAGRVPLTVKRGTETLGRVTVHPLDVEGLYLTVELNPGLAMLDDEVGEAIISTLSRLTQLLIDVQ